REFHRSHTKIVIESCAPCELLFGLRDAVADVFGGVECETAVVDEDSIEGDLLCGKCSIGLFSERKENPLLVQVALRTERLFAMIPTGHALAKKDCVTFSEINGEPVIPFPLKGHWNDLLVRMLPDSQLLYQSSVESFDKVVHASSLISFESNFLEIDVADHVRVPVVDGEARITYHAAVLGRMASSGCFPEFIRSLDSLKD
ncbi:MAG: hypothetical protein IJ673_11755, partial [Treponema sp.]|nr:hypothetical protein [Treponema sp.]